MKCRLNQLRSLLHFDHATEDGAHLDMSMNGLYNDVKVFNLHAPTNHSSAPKDSLSST